MANKRHKPEKIVQKSRQVDALISQRMQRVDAIREARISEPTSYRWCKQNGGKGTAQLNELKRVQKENERLRKAVAIQQPAFRAGRIMNAGLTPICR